MQSLILFFTIMISVGAVVPILRAFSTSCKSISSSSMSYLDAHTSKVIDEVLMSTPGFSIDQLMELAGLSVATAAMEMGSSNWNNQTTVLICAGPGNNGGDGLVAARHLKQFGLQPTIIYPKASKDQLFINLVQQCKDLHIPFLNEAPESMSNYNLIIDALFGFSFKGPTREPFTQLIKFYTMTSTPILSVDIPSGWDVEHGDIFNTNFNPTAVISLTLPKLCMKSFHGVHFIGGRFVPPKIVDLYNVRLPDYGLNANQIVHVLNTKDSEDEL